MVWVRIMILVIVRFGVMVGVTVEVRVSNLLCRLGRFRVRIEVRVRLWLGKRLW